MGWRLIESKITDPFYVTAVDEAISIARKKNMIPDTLHFYKRNPPAVSIGRSRKINDDININECKKNNIKIIRRTSGGGTIFTDKGCLIYSLIFNKDEFGLSSFKDIFDLICNSIVSGLKKIDIKSEYKPPNDILINKRKISGSALILKDNIALIHGTILYNTDLHLMDKVLKNKSKTKVSTIYKETNKKPDFIYLKKHMKKEFEATFDTTFKKEQISNYEKKLIDELLKNRYNNDTWNYKR